MAGSFFGTDGIRDVAGRGLLAPERVQSYGRAVGAWLKAQAGRGRVLMGRDTRSSGPLIRDQLARGIQDYGHQLVDGGILTTPAVQSLCRDEDFHLAIVVSASHNPAADNGIKFFGADGRKLSDEDEQALEGLMQDPPEGSGPGGGALIQDDRAADRYLRDLRETCFPHLDLGGMRVVLDCAHGAGSMIAPKALRSFGARVTVCGARPNGMNINDQAGVFFVERLAAPVASQQALLGLALDGDGDRVLLLDAAGCVRDGDHMLGFLGADLAERGRLRGETLVTTVMANMGLFVFLEKKGIHPEVVSVGDRYVAAAMERSGSVLGGEQSGHIIFREEARWSGDGLLTALHVLELMQRSGRSLAELAAGIEKFPQVLVNVPVRARPPVEEIPGLLAARQKAEEELAQEGRVVLRYSGTEALLRVMVEGREKRQVGRLARKLAAVIQAALGAPSGA